MTCTQQFHLVDSLSDIASFCPVDTNINSATSVVIVSKKNNDQPIYDFDNGRIEKIINDKVGSVENEVPPGLRMIFLNQVGICCCQFSTLDQANSRFVFDLEMMIDSFCFHSKGF